MMQSALARIHMRNCWHCQHLVQDEDFCPYCGQPRDNPSRRVVKPNPIQCLLAQLGDKYYVPEIECKICHQHGDYVINRSTPGDTTSGYMVLLGTCEAHKNQVLSENVGFNYDGAPDGAYQVVNGYALVKAAWWSGN